MNTETILLDHGSGGKLSHDLITETVVPLFANPILESLDDGAVLTLNGCRMAFSTDSFVVDPIFFPGGNIGELAVNGTVNDLAMCGAIPMYLSAGMIIEEGFSLADLKTILSSMQTAAQKAGVHIVTGDTKVVPKRAVDKIFINTSGIGRIPDHIRISGAGARPGDKVILSGTMADHGITVLTQREGLTFQSTVQSDTAALNHMVLRLLEAVSGVRVLRDPTRGGVGTTLNEIAVQSRVGIRIDETRLPIHPEVNGLCELLGLDPLYVANEGKFLAIVDPDQVDTALEIIREDPLGKQAQLIGEVVNDHAGRVVLNTRIGGQRFVDMLTGEQLPRIC